MENQSSNDAQINKQNTVKSLVESDAATFNGLVDAIDGLSDVTDHGIDRIINAVNGLSLAVSTSDKSGNVKDAVSKVLAREMLTVDHVSSIEIKDEPTALNPAIKKEKTQSVDIAKALSSFKPDKAGFYQPNTDNSQRVETTHNEQVFNENSPTSAQQTTINNSIDNVAGGVKTVFNQLKEQSAKQLDTTETITAVDTKLKGTERDVKSIEREVTQSQKPKRPVKHSTVGSPVFERTNTATNNNVISSAEKVTDTLLQSAKHLNNATDSISTIANEQVKDSNTVNVTTNNIDSSLVDSPASTNNTTAKQVTNNASIADLSNTDKSKVSDAVSTNNNNSSKAITTTSNAANSNDTANNDVANVANSSTLNNSPVVDSSVVSNTANAFNDTASPVNNASAISEIETNNTATATSNQQSGKPARKQPAKANKADNASGFYKDSKNRLRTSTGRYASKDEIAAYKKAEKKKSIGSTIAKHVTGRIGRQVIGTAFLGSGYHAIENSYQAAKEAKSAIKSRGLTSVDGVKEYANGKKEQFNQQKNNVTKKATDSISATKGAFSKVKNFFSKSRNSNAVNGGSTTVSHENNNAQSSLVSNADSVENNSNSNVAGGVLNANANQQAISNEAINSIDVQDTTNPSNAVNTAVNTANSTQPKASPSTVDGRNKSGNKAQASKQATKAVSNATARNLAINNSASQSSNKSIETYLNKNAHKSIKVNPSTVDGFTNQSVTPLAGGSVEHKGAINNTTNNSASNTTNSTANNTTSKAVSTTRKGATNAPNKTTIKGRLPLTNSVFIGSQKSNAGMSKKLSKEYHDAHMLKLDELIKEIGTISGGGGGGGGSIIDDALDFNRDRKRRKNRRNRKPRKPSKFNRAKDFLKSGRFFGGGAKVAGAVGAGAVGAGATAIGGAGAATGAAGVAGKAGGFAKMGAGALGGAGRLFSKAIPILALATTAIDAYDGFTNTDKQKETFNLKSTEEPNLGHKSSMALGNVLDLGGLTSGISGLIGDGLGALGFDGAKEAMNFDAGDIAKAIYDKGDAIATSGSGIFSSLGEGDFSGAAGNAATLLKEVIPALGWFTGSDSDKEESKTTEATSENKSSSESSSDSVTEIKDRDTNSTQNLTTEGSAGENEAVQNRNPAMQKKIDKQRKRVDDIKANRDAQASGSVDAIAGSESLVTDISPATEGGAGETKAVTNRSPRVQKRIDEQRKKVAEMKARRDAQANGTLENNVSSESIVNDISTAPAVQAKAIASEPVLTNALAINSKKETVTDVSTLKSNTQTDSANPTSAAATQQNAAPVVITDNAKSLALLREISNKLDLNRKTEKPNTGGNKGSTNSLPINIPAQFSDSLMERLANE